MFLAAQHSGGEFLVLVPSSSLMDGWRQQIEQHTEGTERCREVSVSTIFSSPWEINGAQVGQEFECKCSRRMVSCEKSGPEISADVYGSVGY